MGLFRVIQPVHEIESAARFYEQVLGTSGERVSAGRHYFRCGATVLACCDPLDDGDSMDGRWRPHANQYLYFSTDELQATAGRVEAAGGTIDAPIESMPWGETLFYARDPSGNRIAFVARSTMFVGGSA
jgi:predicted enzyme related to lactoylglutathione lyase